MPYPDVTAHTLGPAGSWPNNPQLALLVYVGAFDLDGDDDGASTIERCFAGNDWTQAWRDGVYDFDHYHATAHEVLGCYRGRASIRFGGEGGIEVELRAGDAVVIPAGVAHRCLSCSADFAVVGAYASGRTYDMRRGDPAERSDAQRRIGEVPPPTADPVLGPRGPLMKLWPPV